MGYNLSSDENEDDGKEDQHSDNSMNNDDMDDH